MATSHDIDAPAALERSRSGNGGHVWLFFSDAAPAFGRHTRATRLLNQARSAITAEDEARRQPSPDRRGGA
jgi:hypothetical protein